MGDLVVELYCPTAALLKRKWHSRNGEEQEMKRTGDST